MDEREHTVEQWKSLIYEEVNIVEVMDNRYFVFHLNLGVNVTNLAKCLVL